MEIAIEKITEHKAVKKLQRNVEILSTKKYEMYECLESVQEYFNRLGIKKFNPDTPHAKEMCEKMKALGFDIN